MKRLALAAVLVCAVAPAAHAQSMNVPLITERVVGEICPPYLAGETMWGPIARAEGFGYEVRHISPSSIQVGAANRQPEPRDVELYGRHAGTIRLWTNGRERFCSVGIHEGAVGQIAEIAEPLLQAQGYEPVLDDRERSVAVSVWRAPGRQVVISRSAEYRPGSEILFTADVAPQVD